MLTLNVANGYQRIKQNGMKKRLYTWILAGFLPVFVLLSCNSQEEPSVVPVAKEQQSDTTILLSRSKEVLEVLKKNDLKSLTSFAAESDGVLFSPYSYLDSTTAVRFTKTSFKKSALSDTFNWGHFDGTGDPIRMTVKEYFQRFVYDKDYLKADKVSVNHTLGKGNSIDNTMSVFPDAQYVEYYFPGFDEAYGGMDWRSLKLVFRKKQGQFYLVAIVHGEWTI